MARNNENLGKAKKEKNDEFYTLLSDIEKEMKYYKEQFKDKVVYCNCDDARQSNFFKYFSLNFEFLGLKKLITTSYNANGNGTILVYEGDKNGNRIVDDEEIQVSELNGNGDFRSEECLELLKQADIVVTNPPFSLFREYFKTLMEYDKKFCVIGNMNALTYKEIFPYMVEGKVWWGESIHSGDRKFYVPENYPLDASGCGIDEDGRRYIKVKGVRWWTNMLKPLSEKLPTLIKTYNETDYPMYDNYDAINVDKTKDIPYDYEGVIGVPITALDYLCSDGLLHFDAPLRTIGQTECSFSLYKIIGITESNGRGFSKGLFNNTFKELKPLINGKKLYARLFIQRVN